MALRFAAFPIVNQVFFQTSLSVAIVNLKPITLGHVLVIPKVVRARFSDLTQAEVSDLFTSAQTISRALEAHYAAQSMTIAIQDGPFAGQSVPHLHVHIIPRKAGDFEPNDAIYEELDGYRYSRPAGVDFGERQPRSKAEMKAEAEELAQLFPLENRGTFEEDGSA